MRKETSNGPQGHGENLSFTEQLLLLVIGFGFNVALVFLPMLLPAEVTYVQLCTDPTIPVESVHANCS
ncbi:hypothetical protein [Nocardia alba]|uniref:Uncharacterized protein n=1 Tax=Nocardia alba TaxID=225051 RepID=A0A4V2P9K2_9NOCA|nr:hypothetical protein [Nocardia alba]TCJ89945.1 hypothetical protein DFR71_6235 [Nocardia alba]